MLVVRKYYVATVTLEKRETSLGTNTSPSAGGLMHSDSEKSRPDFLAFRGKT